MRASRAELIRAAVLHLGGDKRVVSPRRFLEYARPKSSPIHHLFPWDDAKAAEWWRLERARELIQSVRVVIEASKGPRNIRAFYSVRDERTDERGYAKAESILGDKDWRQQLLEAALAELTVFKTKYAMLEELAEVFVAADRVSRKRKAA